MADLLTEDERETIAGYLGIPTEDVYRVEFFIDMKLAGHAPAAPSTPAPTEETNR